ncbi:Z-ring formation inhibitor MciZ [Cohnella cholangitidis]|uniref:Z-ring formation inhibitor MciZ n=1 Tax=Cohnella cholangitidis TaxID=2598458 RepID=A0A7G5C7L1_9BACL|nr:Z-ring formation inhibitor MciZ [Cohnella cholangitidis]QMV45195.1 Z-ring formation inhibitor MciZ [Cohnella cholangitidis]
MKKYVTPHKLQFVGKAWEIRHALRQEKKRRGENLPLAVLLSEKMLSVSK